MITIVNKRWTSGELTAARCSLCFDLAGGAWQDPSTSLSSFGWEVDVVNGNIIPRSFRIDEQEIFLRSDTSPEILSDVNEIRGDTDTATFQDNVLQWARKNFPVYNYTVIPNGSAVAIYAKRPGAIYDHVIDLSGVPTSVFNTVILTQGGDPEIVKDYVSVVFIYKNGALFSRYSIYPYKKIAKPSGVITINSDSDLSNVTKTLLDPSLSSVPVITGNPIGTPIAFEDSAALVRIVVGESIGGEVSGLNEDTPPTPMIHSKCYDGGPDLSYFTDDTDLVPLLDRPSSIITWAKPYPAVIPYYFDPASPYTVELESTSYPATHASTDPYIGYFHINDEIETGSAVMANNSYADFSVTRDGGVGRPLTLHRMPAKKECQAVMFMFLNSRGAFEPFYGFNAYEGELNYEVSDMFRCNPCDVGKADRTIYRYTSERSDRLYSERGFGNRDWFRYFRSFFTSEKIYRVNLETNTYDLVKVEAEQIVFRPSVNRISVPFSYKSLGTHISLPKH